MIKVAIVKKFLKKDKYVVYPLTRVKDHGSYASEPFQTNYSLSTSDLLDCIFSALKSSKEGTHLPATPKERVAEFLKQMGVKSMKDLHSDSIQLTIIENADKIAFRPSENKGPKMGFVGLSDDMSVELPIDSPQALILNALELALSRCK